MLEIPEILKGKEVEKFEYLLGQYIKTDALSPDDEIIHISKSDWIEILKIRLFYTQPFTPDMIEKYFEGWGKNEDESSNLEKVYDKGEYPCIITRDADWKWSAVTIEHTPNTHFSFEIVHTLSDFIDACLNSEINLQWRK